MKSFSILLLLSCCLFAGTNAHGAAGELDLTFDAGSVLDNSAYAIAIQPDGKLLIGGDFTTVPGLARNRIARLNADGSGDPSFDPGRGAEWRVSSIALQPDGKVVVGGWFTNFDGASHNRIVRLNTNGSVDSGFRIGSGADDSIFAVVRQTDGKILIGGYFTNVSGLSRPHLARLNADGSVDTGFNPGANSTVYAMVLQPDGKVVVGGSFTALGGVNINRIARLNQDGSLDATFNPGTGVDYFGVTSLALQPDGGVLIGGYFGEVNGQGHKNIARLNADGSVDASFTGASSDWVGPLAVQADGKIVVAGEFYLFYDWIPSYLARLHPDGSLDDSFAPPLQIQAPGVSSIAVESNGTILVSGELIGVNGLGPKRIVRLNQDGSVNNTMNSSTGIDGSVVSGCVQPDGRIVIAGSFQEVNKQRHQGIARLESDGRVDGNFDTGPILNTAYYTYSNPIVYSIALQPDGRIVAGGGFTNINGIGRNNIARFNSDGSVDPSFNPGAGTDDSVYRVVLQPDGKVLITGVFMKVDSIPRRHFARLNADGSLDSAFNPNVLFVYDAAVQMDGKIVIVGAGSTNGTFVERLNSDGSVDSSFIGPQPDFLPISSVALQSDGKILIGGVFYWINGIRRPGMARLNSDGSLDPSFYPEIRIGGVVDLVRGFLLQQDGKIIVSGVNLDFSGFIARMNPDGSIDGDFRRCTAQEFVVPIALQPDSKVIIGGDFSTANGVARHSIARLLGDGPVIVAQPASRTNVVATTATFSVSASGAPVLRYQWYRDGLALSDSAQIVGATSATLTLKHAQFRDGGAYTVTVSNEAGSVTSDAVTLRITTPAAGRK